MYSLVHSAMVSINSLIIRAWKIRDFYLDVVKATSWIATFSSKVTQVKGPCILYRLEGMRQTQCRNDVW